MNAALVALAAVELAAIVAVVILFLRRQREQETAWTDERRELLTRIQRPELVPVKRTPAATPPPPPPRTQANMIGRVADPLPDDGEPGDGEED